MEKLREIKEKVLEIKRLFAEGNFIEGDSLLVDLFENGAVERLIEYVEELKVDLANYESMESLRLMQLKKAKDQLEELSAHKKPKYMDLDDE